ncbi:MAG: hypothetical protein ACPGUD_14065 [Parashewanella sp.]
MTKPEITLQAAVMSFDEAMQHWIATNPVYQHCLKAIQQSFPVANQDIKQLYLLLTDAIYINDGLLFDYCLCKALHQYQALIHEGELAAYTGFSEALLGHAEAALDSCVISDPKGGSWSIDSGKNFRDWLDEQPRRFMLLEQWELEVVCQI